MPFLFLEGGSGCAFLMGLLALTALYQHSTTFFSFRFVALV